MTNFGVYAPNSGRVINAQLKVLIADITLTNSSSFEAIPIPGGFDHLRVEVNLRSAAAVDLDGVRLFYNGDATEANYSAQNLEVTATSVVTARSDTGRFGSSTGASSTSGDFWPTIIDIPMYCQAGYRRSSIATGAGRRGATSQQINVFAHNWESTEPITAITIRTDNHPTDLFVAGSRLQVFGLGTFAVALVR
jgi:hypothetical protein